MSRIGKKPIFIKENVELVIQSGNIVTTKGPLGTLTFNINPEMILEVEDRAEGKFLVVKCPNEEKKYKCLFGTTRTIINNMVVGVSEGFKKELVINGVGYRAQKNGKKLIMSLGYSHPVEMEEIEGITIEVPAPNQIVVIGTDKQKVGQFAANIRTKKPPEPYKGKGLKYLLETIRRKSGKSGSKKK